MNTPLDRFLQSLPTGQLTKADLLGDATRLFNEGPIAAYYVPFDYFPLKAQVLLVGITPGFTQMRLGYEAARDFLSEAASEQDLHRVAKQAASFGGPMRRLLCDMLSSLELPQAIGLSTAESMFQADCESVAFTSVLRYPVFVNGENYTGHSPKVTKSDFLMGMVRDYFGKAVEEFSEALIVPMGRAVEEVLQVLNLPNPVLRGFPHPSPANGHRKRQFEANQEAMKLIIRDWKN